MKPEREYKDWRWRVDATIDSNESWSRIGEWAYPSKKNSHREIFFHLCEGTHQRVLQGGDNSADAMNGETCHSCGATVPDGIKMISLLGMLP